LELSDDYAVLVCPFCRLIHRNHSAIFGPPNQLGHPAAFDLGIAPSGTQKTPPERAFEDGLNGFGTPFTPATADLGDNCCRKILPARGLQREYYNSFTQESSRPGDKIPARILLLGGFFSAFYNPPLRGQMKSD
jgi:hypothetical protein